MNSTYDQYKEDDFILKSKWKKYEWKKNISVFNCSFEIDYSLGLE